MKEFRKNNNDTGEIMINRCDLCGLYGCRHVNSRMPLEPVHGSRASNITHISSEGVSLGEKVGDAMENFSKGVDTRVVVGKDGKKYWSPSGKTNGDNQVADVNKSLVSTIPMGPTQAALNVVIPAPPRVPIIASPAGQITAVSYPVPVPVNRSLQTIDMKNEWVHCNICSARVNVHYLDQHLKVHTHNYEPKTGSGTVTTTSTAIVHRPVTSNVSSITSVTPYRARVESPSIPKLKPIESYKFKPLEYACCASSVSQSGRYSDFTIILWGKEKTFVNNTTYSGGYSSSTTKDWERFSIHVVYDSKEDYYTVTCKLLKRASYSTFDTEETIPDRICYQDELLTEIKRALLFFKISPRSAYKQFLKLMRGPMKVEYDKRGRACIAQSVNSEALNERLKKPATAYDTKTGWEGMYGGDYA